MMVDESSCTICILAPHFYSAIAEDMGHELAVACAFRRKGDVGMVGQSFTVDFRYCSTEVPFFYLSSYINCTAKRSDRLCRTGVHCALMSKNERQKQLKHRLLQGHSSAC